ATVRARLSVSTDEAPCRWPSWAWPSAMRGHVVGVGEDLLDEAAHVGIVDDVEDARPLAAAADEPGQAELGQVLRDGGRLGTHDLRQLVDRVLALQEGPDDAQPRLVAEELEHPDGGPELL